MLLPAETQEVPVRCMARSPPCEITRVCPRRVGPLSVVSRKSLNPDDHLNVVESWATQPDRTTAPFLACELPWPASVREYGTWTA